MTEAGSAWMPALVRSPSVEMNAAASVPAAKAARSFSLERSSVSSRIETRVRRSEEHTSELQSLLRISYAVFCFQKKKPNSAARLLRHKETRAHCLRLTEED